MATIKNVLTTIDAASLAGINQAQRVIDMDDVIHDLDPQATALTVLLMKLRKETSFSPKFEYMEDAYRPRSTAINNGAGYADTILVFTVDDATWLRPFDLIQNTRTLEVFLITVIGSATSITVAARPFGETAKAALVDNDVLEHIGNAMQEGDVMPAMRMTKVTNDFNYTQIFRESFGVTRTENDSKLYGGQSMGRLRRKHAIEHMLQIERAMWWGERKEYLSDQHPRRTTRGVMRHLLQAGSGAQIVDAGDATLDEAMLDAWAEKLFRYGSSAKFVFTSRLGLTRLSTIAKGAAGAKIQMFPNDQIYGVRIYTYISPHGEMKFVVNNLFVGTGGGAAAENRWGGWMVALDLAQLSLVTFNGADTKLYVNRQANDVDGMIDEYLTECGLKMYQLPHHGYIKNFK